MAAERTRESERARPISPEAQKAIAGFDESKRIANALLTEFTPEQRAQYVGFFKFPAEKLGQIAKADKKFARFRVLIEEGKAAITAKFGSQLTNSEMNIAFGYILTGTELSPADFEAKLQEALTSNDYLRSRRLHYATKSRAELEKLFEEEESRGKTGVAKGGAISLDEYLNKMEKK